jgi:rRNA maturation protein Nop10
LLPSQSSQSSGSSALPIELNPLSNPILAENLRRWAEVYFSNPPERREQAISELLRELQEQKAQQRSAAAETSSVPHPEPSGIFSASNAPSFVRCKSCGHDNVMSERFCGMCGAVVEMPEPPAYSQFDRISQQDWETNRNAGSVDQEAEESWDSESDSVPDYEEVAPSTNDLSLFQAVARGSGSDDPVWEYDTSPSPPSYRFYIGLALAIMLVGLGYWAWRGMQGNSQSHQVSAPPPAVAKDADTPPAQAPPPKAEEALPPENAAQAPPSQALATKPETKVAGNSQSEPNPAAEREHIPAFAQADAGRGEKELSTAEQYLYGADGKRRDASEASKLLWKALQKHNDKAALPLADLYLKGDGVPKNCEQARVLLYSAARKGTSGAGERLRNLAAFGCQ